MDAVLAFIGWMKDFSAAAPEQMEVKDLVQAVRKAEEDDISIPRIPSLTYAVLKKAQ